MVAAHSTLLIYSWYRLNDSTERGWELHKVLKAIQNIFNESRTRRDVYLREGSSNKFPIKFCETRLIEDKEVAGHALEAWESVVATIRY